VVRVDIRCYARAEIARLRQYRGRNDQRRNGFYTKTTKALVIFVISVNFVR